MLQAHRFQQKSACENQEDAKEKDRSIPLRFYEAWLVDALSCQLQLVGPATDLQVYGEKGSEKVNIVDILLST